MTNFENFIFDKPPVFCIRCSDRGGIADNHTGAHSNTQRHALSPAFSLVRSLARTRALARAVSLSLCLCHTHTDTHTHAHTHTHTHAEPHTHTNYLSHTRSNSFCHPPPPFTSPSLSALSSLSRYVPFLPPSSLVITACDVVGARVSHSLSRTLPFSFSLLLSLTFPTPSFLFSSHGQSVPMQLVLRIHTRANTFSPPLSSSLCSPPSLPLSPYNQSLPMELWGGYGQ